MDLHMVGSEEPWCEHRDGSALVQICTQPVGTCGSDKTHPCQHNTSLYTQLGRNCRKYCPMTLKCHEVACCIP